MCIVITEKLSNKKVLGDEAPVCIRFRAAALKTRYSSPLFASFASKKEEKKKIIRGPQAPAGAYLDAYEGAAPHTPLFRQALSRAPVHHGES
jgi:hypothetical protein